MSRVNTIQNNFTAGEVSPKVYGRVDLARYQNGAKSLENCLVQIHGGAQRRPGKLYVAATKDSTKTSRLIPFAYSTDLAYVLEFGDLYMRVYLQSGGQVLNGGGLPYEIVTPYTEAMLRDMDYTRSGDTMFIFHSGVLINILRRWASDNWTIQTAPFIAMPFDELGHTFANTLTLSAKTVGTGRIATASAASFLQGDTGRPISFQGGLAKITGFTSTVQVTVEITAEFPALLIAASAWLLEGSPQAACTPSVVGPVGVAVTLSTGAVASFRTIDSGKYVRINGGLVKVTGFTDAFNLTGIVETVLASVTPSPPNAWTLETAVWNATDGYPRTGTIYEQRLIAAGSPRFLQTVWGSRSGQYLDFTLGDADDDAFAFTLPSTEQVNPITRMSAVNSLIPLTYGGEFTIVGGVEKPLTPTNKQIKSPSVFGCNKVKAVRIGNELMFVQRAGRKVRAFSYKAIEESYTSPDLTVLAQHITKSGIVDMAYQQEGTDGDFDSEDHGGSILWCVRADGKMATLTIDRDEGVTAWTPQVTDGLYESVCSIPNPTGDEVWVIVKRTINGVTKRYVERFDQTLLTDCAIFGTSGPGAAVWAGLAHLEGKSVAVKADGAYLGLFVVTGGQIEIPRPAFDIEIGLPYTNTVELLRPEIQAGDGTAQGNAMSTSEVALLFKDTIGGMVNGVPLSLKKFDEDLLDEAPTEFSGFDRLGITDFQRGDSPIVITQSEPLPFHLLAVIRKLTVNS